MPKSKTLVGSILDLPEPIRSQSLARRGMTAAEFEAHQAGREALIAEAQAPLRKRGETTASGSEGDDEDIDVKSASISVVRDWEPS
jgi:hypothetical protein